GHLEVFGLASNPYFFGHVIFSNVYSNGQWSGWSPWSSGEAAISPNGSWWTVVACPLADIFGNDPCAANLYHFTSTPTVTSWGPGRMDMFAYATGDTGAVALLDSWADGGVWSGNWEVLGTGLMPHGPTDRPAATSWGPGRLDVFVRGGGNEL